MKMKNRNVALEEQSEPSKMEEELLPQSKNIRKITLSGL
jgi:hypothetical protein